MRITVVALILFVAACAAPQPVPPKYGENSYQAQMLRHYGSQMINLHCNKQWAGAGFHTATAAGISFQQPCGLLALDFSNDPATKCPAQDNGECTQRVWSMFEARLALRYTAADRTAVANHCRGYPTECRTFLELEELYLKNHNRRVIAAWDTSKYQVAAQQQRDDELRKFLVRLVIMPLSLY